MYSRAQHNRTLRPQWGNSNFINKIRYQQNLHYYNAKFEKNEHDIKKTWRTLADSIQISKNKPNRIKCILDYERPVTDQLEIDNKFNYFFLWIVVPPSPKICLQLEIITIENVWLVTLCHRTVDDDIIAKTLHSIKSKSSSGRDGISTKLLKFLSPALISPLLAIINQTLNTGINSDKLKIAKVIPLFKKDDTAKTDNYRSISLLVLNLENIRESCIQPVVQIFYTKQFVLWQSIRF